jgi:exopolysaccharide biosynthesis WecB/TagA/CpsF family protein/anti-anti-sigma factor
MNTSESPPEQKTKQVTPIVILSVPFDIVTTAQTLALVGQMIESRRPHYLIMADVDFAVRAMRDVEVRRILLEAHLILSDGMPLVWASRWLGNPLPERIAAPDLVPAMLRSAEEKGWRVFFLGSREETLARATEKLRAQHPRLQIAGHLCPPVPLSPDVDHAAICRAIRDAKPDILLVAFGSPDQEQWVNTRYRATGVPVSVGVGDAMDFVAGVAPRAPMWMQRAGLEWLFRLMREPRRLCGRYLLDLWVFAWAILGQWWRLQVRRRRVAKYRRLMVVAEKTESGFEMVKIPPRFDAAVVREHEWLWKCFAAGPVHLLFDMTHVQFIDSTGIGLLIRLHKMLSAANCRFVLVSLSRIAQESLERVRVPDLLTIVPTLDAAKDVVAGRPGGVQAAATLDLSSAPAPLMWHGEIVATNVEAVQHLSESYLESCAAEMKRCVIDLTGVSFISSAGVGLMGRLKKLGRLRGVEVSFINPQPNVLKVIQTFRLDKLLFGEST